MRVQRMLAAVVISLVFQIPISSYADGDLAIGTDAKTHRPNVFIAWRNTDRILEVEVEVVNFGETQAEGMLKLAILDEEGTLLAQSPGPDQESIRVELPPAERGGDDGKIVQLHGTKELNLLIDRLDRNNSRYKMRIDFVPESGDSNYVNNTSFKSFNVNAKVRPGAIQFYDYYLRNSGESEREVRLDISVFNMPAGWQLDTQPANGSFITLAPGEVFQGTAFLKTPEGLENGQHVDIRFLAVDTSGSQVIDGAEWYAVYDTTKPQITKLDYSVNETTGQVRVQVSAVDDDSMIKEASGVSIQYSTDGGVTFSNRVAAYLDGNFVGPTRFQTDLGPFAVGTEVQMAVIVEDIAGNRSEQHIPVLKIPRKTMSKLSAALVGGL